MISIHAAFKHAEENQNRASFNEKSSIDQQRTFVRRGIMFLPFWFGENHPVSLRCSAGSNHFYRYW
jgi:hypothetical protein